jgi:hypothetical protein
MSDKSWEVVDEVAGDLQAEIVRTLLESFGLQVWLSQEGAGRAYAMNVGTLGRAQVLVPKTQAEDARKIIQKYYAGELAHPEEEYGNEDDGSEFEP